MRYTDSDGTHYKQGYDNQDILEMRSLKSHLQAQGDDAAYLNDIIKQMQACIDESNPKPKKKRKPQARTMPRKKSL